MRSSGTSRCWPGRRRRVTVVRRLGDLSLALGDTPEAVHWWRRAAAAPSDVALLVQLAQAESRVATATPPANRRARHRARARRRGRERLQTLLDAKN